MSATDLPLRAGNEMDDEFAEHVAEYIAAANRTLRCPRSLANPDDEACWKDQGHTPFPPRMVTVWLPGDEPPRRCSTTCW